MTDKERQAQLDTDKWSASQDKGHDCCGEFDYCGKCNKEEEFPCAKAYTKFHEKPAAAKKPAAATAAAKKPAAAKKK